MRTIILALAVFGLSTATVSQTRFDSLDSLAWLAGCWENRGPEFSQREQWMQPEGSMMMGMSHFVRKGSTRDYEFLRMVRNADSTVQYVALPSGQQETAFLLIDASHHRVVFENTAHDFPQRIMYELDPDGTLRARIEGVRNGKEKGVDFVMKRVACE